MLERLPHIRVGRIQAEEKKETSAADVATIRRLYSDATNVAGSVWEIGADRRHARSESGARAGRWPGAGGVGEPHGADRADRAEELRQLHLHAHGERVDPDDVAGARAGHRRRDAARARPGGADARHRQGAHADRDPQQARQADRRRIHGDAHARRRRRRDPAAHAGDAGGGAGDRLRASPASRRHRLSVRRLAQRA